MEQENVELEQPTADDDQLLDHHIEEILGALANVARKREADPDAEEPPLD